MLILKTLTSLDLLVLVTILTHQATRVRLLVPALLRIVHEHLLRLRLDRAALLARLASALACTEGLWGHLRNTMYLLDAGHEALAVLASPIDHLLEPPPREGRIPSALTAAQAIRVRIVRGYLIVRI